MWNAEGSQPHGVRPAHFLSHISKMPADHGLSPGETGAFMLCSPPDKRRRNVLPTKLSRAHTGHLLCGNPMGHKPPLKSGHHGFPKSLETPTSAHDGNESSVWETAPSPPWLTSKTVSASGYGGRTLENNKGIL